MPVIFTSGTARPPCEGRLAGGAAPATNRAGGRSGDATSAGGGSPAAAAPPSAPGRRERPPESPHDDAASAEAQLIGFEIPSTEPQRALCVYTEVQINTVQ